MAPVSFDAHPASYRHWSLELDGEVARLVLDVDEHGGIVDGYELKMNSYDLGVDIELSDAVQRLRFEHPEVRAVIVTSGKDRMFSAGANIQMLAQSSHEWKVNFCKFTNETRNAIEDATVHSGQTYLAALNGPAAGGGYELALACERIVLIDDGSSAVSLPEVPLLGVLPGTGGLVRVVDKRRVRKDLADVFATRSDGVRGQTAAAWGLVDEVVPRGRFDEVVRERAARAAATSGRPTNATGIALRPLDRTVTDTGIEYRNVTADLDRTGGLVAITVHGPAGDAPDIAAIHEQGADFWPLAVARELDDLILRLRTNEPELGTWVLRTRGDVDRTLGFDALVSAPGDWLAGEIRHYLKRTLKRLDVTSRSLIALIEPGSCFAGVLFELALACDRQYMLSDDGATTVVLTESNFGAYPMGNGLTRLASRFYGDPDHHDRLRKHEVGKRLSATDAERHGLVTFAPDDLDWDDEVRMALQARASLSPDALTAMEANHRFVGPETIETKIFGRLSAWQNWVFQRPNASGAEGALRRYGSGQRPTFDRRRT